MALPRISVWTSSVPSYLVGGKPFPSADVDEHDIRAVLEPDFDPATGSIEVCELAEHEAQGYSSIVLAWRRRRIETAGVALRDVTLRGLPPRCPDRGAARPALLPVWVSVWASLPVRVWAWARARRSPPAPAARDVA